MGSSERIMDATDEKLLENLFGFEPTSRTFIQSRALLEFRSSGRMEASSKRIEWATWIILLATLAMLLATTIHLFLYVRGAS